MHCNRAALQPPPVPISRDGAEQVRRAAGELKPPRDATKKIIEALRKHPNVFDLKADFPSKDEIISLHRLGMLVDGQLFQMRIHLPKTRQKYQDMDCKEHFSVLCRGSVFCAFAEVEDFPVWTNMGHEFREIAKHQIENETTFECPGAGPCPLHPDIYILFCEDGPQGGLNDRVHEYEGNLLVLVSDIEGQPVLADVIDVFLEIDAPVLSFYRLVLDRSDLIEYSIEISNSFEDISVAVAELIKTPIWRVLKTHTLSRKAKEVLSNIHVRLFQFADGLMSFKPRRNSFHR